MLSIIKVRARLGAVNADVAVHTSWYKTVYIMIHGGSKINYNIKYLFSNKYVITNTFISLLKLIVFLQSCMKVYINSIVMVNSFLANMNVITYAYHHFPISVKTYVCILFVSNSTYTRNNTQRCHQIWKVKMQKDFLLIMYIYLHEFFTQMETSTMPIKNFKVLPKLSLMTV